MNPMNWRREHQLALLLGGAIGIATGLLIGYMYYGLWSMYVGILHAIAATAGKAPGPPRVDGVVAWLGSGSSFRWGAFGALVGGAAIYTRQLLHA
jgi:hypothetical protein